MKQLSLTRILVTNWDQIQQDLADGVLLINVFAKLEKQYKIKRANSTWYTTYSRLKKKMGNEGILQYNQSESVKSVAAPATTKSKSWTATSTTGENPILAKLKKKS